MEDVFLVGSDGSVECGALPGDFFQTESIECGASAGAEQTMVDCAFEPLFFEATFEATLARAQRITVANHYAHSMDPAGVRMTTSGVTANWWSGRHISKFNVPQSVLLNALGSEIEAHLACNAFSSPFDFAIGIRPACPESVDICNGGFQIDITTDGTDARIGPIPFQTGSYRFCRKPKEIVPLKDALTLILTDVVRALTENPRLQHCYVTHVGAGKLVK